LSPTVAALADVGIVTESAPEPAKGSVAVRLYAPAPAPYGVPKPSMAGARAGEEKFLWPKCRAPGGEFSVSARGKREALWASALASEKERDSVKPLGVGDG
jgi:hypothetical protein